MKVQILKNWGTHQKDDVVEILDNTLIKKGLSVKLFKNVEKVEKPETKK